jgi:hypothetical protein
MASERKGGLGTLPAGLLRPTTTPPDAEAGPSSDVGEPAGSQGGGASAEPKPRTRTRRPPVTTEATKGRKLHLPDDVHDRLWQLARQRRKTVSAVAAEILDRNLPRFRVEREG